MRAVVVDASFTLAWCFDEKESAEAAKLLGEVGLWRVLAPGLWEMEVANGLATAERRGRLTASESAQFLGMLEDLGVEVDEERGPRLRERVLALARGYGLTAYDAAYLELAIREGAVLASFDEQMRKAAKRAGVEVWARSGKKGR